MDDFRVRLFLTVLFIIGSLYLSRLRKKFNKEEGKDERGKWILYRSSNTTLLLLEAILVILWFGEGYLWNVEGAQNLPVVFFIIFVLENCTLLYYRRKI